MNAGHWERIKGAWREVPESSRENVILITVCGLIFLALALISGFSLGFMAFVLLTMVFYAVLSLGLNVQWGFTGLLNFGIIAYVAMGAYTTVLFVKMGIPYIGSTAVGVLMAAAAGLGIGALTLRMRAEFLAIVTLGFGEIVRYFLMNEEWLTRGVHGIGIYARPLKEVFGGNYNLFLIPVLVGFLVILYFVLQRMVNSPWGRVLKAIREDEDVANSLGKNVYRFRLQSFMVGCGIVAIAGSIFALYMGYVYPRSFMPIYSFYAWTAVIIGGSANNKGVIMGALIFEFIMAATRFAGPYIGAFLALFGIPEIGLGPRIGAFRMIIIGLLLVIFLMFRPQGILGKREEMMVG